MTELGPWQLTLHTPLGSTARFAVMAVAASALALQALRLTLRHRRGALALTRLGILMALRLAGLATALAVVLQPAAMQPMLQKVVSHVVLLLDTSGSMELPTERTEAGSRRARLAELLTKSRSTLDRWRDDHPLTVFSFAERPAPSSEAAARTGALPSSGRTRLRAALDELREQLRGAEVSAVVVISDGIDTDEPTRTKGARDRALGAQATAPSSGADGPAAATDLDRSAMPIHTVLVGHTDLPDIAIERVHADDFAFVRTVISVEVELRTTGIGAPDAPLQVTLARDGQALQSRPLAVDAQGVPLAHQTLRFSFTPERVGDAVYEVAATAAPDEVTLANNRARFVLKVLRDKIRVLHVAGQPSWDVRFLRALLKQTANVDLISFFILRTLTDVQMAPTSDLALIPFPTRELFEEELGSFDVVILQNFEYGPYQMGPYLDRIREFVEKRGGGLVMVGGDLSFSSGGYSTTPLAEVLPVELFPSTLAPEQLVAPAPFRPVLTPEGMRHPVMELRREPDENRSAWAALTPLAGANRIARARPGAQVLATHPTERGLDGQPMPIIAAADIGKGRSVAIAADSTWAWGFGAAVSDSGQQGRAYARLWGNLFRWLTKDPEHELLKLEVLRDGDATTAKVAARDAGYRPAPNVAVALTAFSAGADRLGAPVWQGSATTDTQGEAKTALPALPEGAYRLVAEASLAGRPARDERAFVVDRRDTELLHPVPRAELLRELAKHSGGTFLDNPATLAGLTIPPARRIPVGRHREVELWSRSWVLVGLVALLAAEWLLRRRWGLR